MLATDRLDGFGRVYNKHLPDWSFTFYDHDTNFPESDHDDHTEAMKTTYLNILGVRGGATAEDADWTALWDGNTGDYKDLLWYLFNGEDWYGAGSDEQKKNPSWWAGHIQTDQELPDAIKNAIKDRVFKCADAWNNEEIKDMYSENGGRPLMGYNKYDGLICRNIPYSIDQVPTKKWKFHVGEGCVGSRENGKLVDDAALKGLRCENSQDTCEWGNDEDFPDNVIGYINSQNPISINNRCTLPACAEDPLICPGQNAANAVMGAWSNFKSENLSWLPFVE